MEYIILNKYNVPLLFRCGDLIIYGDIEEAKRDCGEGDSLFKIEKVGKKTLTIEASSCCDCKAKRIDEFSLDYECIMTYEKVQKNVFEKTFNKNCPMVGV